MSKKVDTLEWIENIQKSLDLLRQEIETPLTPEEAFRPCDLVIKIKSLDDLKGMLGRLAAEGRDINELNDYDDSLCSYSEFDSEWLAVNKILNELGVLTM